MKINAIMERKAPSIRADSYSVDDVIVLPEEEYSSLYNDLPEDREYFEERKEKRYDSVLVLGEGQRDGILVNTQGCSYARLKKLRKWKRMACWKILGTRECRCRKPTFRLLFRPCAKVSGKDGQAHGKAASGKIRAFLRAVCRAGFKGVFRPKSKVDFQAGERVGAENGTRLGSLRTATPSVLLWYVVRIFVPMQNTVPYSGR